MKGRNDMASKAAVRVGVKMREAFVKLAREEAMRSGSRFTGSFLLSCFVETVGGLSQTIHAAGLTGGAEDWREVMEEMKKQKREGVGFDAAGRAARAVVGEEDDADDAG